MADWLPLPVLCWLKQIEVPLYHSSSEKGVLRSMIREANQRGGFPKQKASTMVGIESVRDNLSEFGGKV